MQTRHAKVDTLFCRSLFFRFAGAQRLGPKGPWGELAHGALWGYSEAIPNGKPFRMESYSEAIPNGKPFLMKSYSAWEVISDDRRFLPWLAKLRSFCILNCKTLLFKLRFAKFTQFV